MNDVIGYAFRGHHAGIVFDEDDPLGESTCIACGECVPVSAPIRRPLHPLVPLQARQDFSLCADRHRIAAGEPVHGVLL